MIKFKRLTIALAALLITSATAWAQTPGTAQFTVPSTWEEDETNLSATNLPSDFVAVTEDAAAYAIANPDPTADAVILIYGFDGTKVKMIIYSGDEKTPESNGAELGSIYILSSYGTKFYYTTAGNSGTPVEGFNWDGTNKTGTFTMPAGNVTLNVEYEPEFTATFKALTANTIEGGKATVTLTDNTEGAQAQPKTPDADGKLTPVYEGQTITLTAQTGYKFRTVTAKKGAGVATIADATAEDIGKVVCAEGHLHDAKTAVPEGCTAVGILGKVSSKGHGLILALKDATNQTWNTINGWVPTTLYAGTTLKVLPATARGSLTSYTKLGTINVSDWAVAHAGDYAEIFNNLGTNTNEDGYTYDSNVNAYLTTNVGGTALSEMYWTISDLELDGCAFNETYLLNTPDNSDSNKVRPVLGF